MHILYSSLLLLCCAPAIGAEKPEDFVKKVYSEKISLKELAGESRFEEILSIALYMLSYPVCREHYLTDESLLKFRVDLGVGTIQTVGDLLKLAADKNFQPKELPGCIILQSPEVLRKGKVPLDTPCPPFSFHGKVESFLWGTGGADSPIGVATMKSGMLYSVDRRDNDKECSVELKVSGTLRDALSAFADQNGWAWNAVYDPRGEPKNVSSDLPGGNGCVVLYKRAPSQQAQTK